MLTAHEKTTSISLAHQAADSITFDGCHKIYILLYGDQVSTGGKYAWATWSEACSYVRLARNLIGKPLASRWVI